MAELMGLLPTDSSAKGVLLTDLTVGILHLDVAVPVLRRRSGRGPNPLTAAAAVRTPQRLQSAPSMVCEI
jgi:hypothetical protein